jgi:hypothetical protein
VAVLSHELEVGGGTTHGQVMAKRWFKTKPWRLLERGEPVQGDCSVELVESDEGMSIAITEFLGRGTTLTRTEAVLVEQDWDLLVAAIDRWRRRDPSELLRLLISVEMERAAEAVQRAGDTSAARLQELARHLIARSEARR